MNFAKGFATPLSLVAALACAAPLAAQDQTPAATRAAQSVPPAAVDRPAMSALDLVTLPRLGSAAVDRAGTTVLYPVTTTDPATLARTTTLMVRPLAGDAPARTVDLGGPASGVQYGGDGWVYFLAARGEGAKTQIWRTRLDAAGMAGAAEQVTDFPADAAGFVLSPDARRMVVYGDFARSCATFGCADTGGSLPGPGSGRLYSTEDGFVRHWDGWETPGEHGRAFAFDIVGGKATGGVPLDGGAAEGALVGDTPTKPFGGNEEIAWAPDGRSVYFAARRSDAREPTSTNIDIWQSDLSGRAPTNLTASNEATDTPPAPSPNGRWLAWAAMARPGYEADRLVIWLRDLRTGAVRPLTEPFDRSFGSIAWTPDSRWIVATAQDTLDTPAFRIDPRTGRVERLDLIAGNEAHIANVVPLPGNRLLFTRDSVGNPAELYLSANWRQATPLTDVATTQMGQRASIATRRFSFAGAGGATVWGQIHKPETVHGPLPAILYVHGGPQGSFNDSWSTRWNPKVLASQGYAVISIDFHGSTGYGQAFVDAINRDWGGKPLVDLQKGLEAALAIDPQIDGNRACAMGASYGGYMMNWIAGQWPDRFACLVNHNGLFDMRSFYYATEEQWFPRWDFGGTYGEARAVYDRWNPSDHVANWRTPMLVVLGERDYRVPYTQGLGAFTALQERGIPAQLLVFPDENHWVLGAKNSLQWHNTVFAWLDRWLRPATPAATAPAQ